jgi:NAD(P)-dependent dehydrogenase (short-subunit alcohol dehydrogenase family)
MAKVWFVTGANSGIGKAITEVASQAGNIVIAAGRNKTALEAIKQFAPNQIHISVFDVNDETACKAAINQVAKDFGKVDVLINNAGYGLEGALEEISMAQLRHQMETNFFGLAALIQAALPYMRAQKNGYIVNVSSIAGLRGFGGMSAYNASKFAVVGLSEALYQELSPFGIKVSVVEPGPYRTDWAGRSLIKSEAIQALDSSSPYYQLNQQLESLFSKTNGNQPGDPYQIAKVLLAAEAHPKPPLHMLFGDEAINAWQDKLNRCNNTEFLQGFPHGKTDLG